jgi:NAD(P)-dependent dehydrogenase (short-subunit alcohol dehydrogenase family)
LNHLVVNFKKSMTSLSGKTILITGATDGLGKEVAKRALKAGANVLIHGRNKQKGENVVSELINETNSNTIKYYNADFSSLQQVKDLSQQILAEYNKIDVLINNAAIGGGPKGGAERELGADGYELRFAVNHLAHFLLTQNLLYILKDSAPSRIVHVSSIGQLLLDFDDIMMEKKFDSYTAYCRSKLAQIMYGFELAEKLKGSRVTVNSLHPATLMDTNMVHDFFGRVTSTIHEGADVVDYVAFSAETENITGAYFNQKREAKANAQAYDKDAREKLWQVSEELVKPFFL